MIISKFKLNRDKKINVLLRDLKSFIGEFPNDSNIDKYLNYISKKLKIPKSVLSKEIKILIFKKFKNNDGKFDKCFKLHKLFWDGIKFLLFYIYVFLFSKQINLKRKKFDILIDDLDQDNTNKKFLNFEKYFKVVYLFNYEKKRRTNYLFFNNYKKCSNDVLFFRKPKIFFLIFFSTFYYSFKSLNNLFPFIIDFFKVIIKYETVFKVIKVNHLIQERHYNTSSLKNYIFKKLNDGKYCSTQRNILQMNGIGMYIHSDILFSLGKKTTIDIKKRYGGEVKKIFPVGSLAMELNFHKRKDKNNLEKYDLIIFASDHNKFFHSGYNSYYDEYLEHYDWIKKFSQQNKTVKIGIKLKKIVTDKNVIQKFKNIDNVQFLVDKSHLSDSYYYAAKAKAICTWSSTLAYEFLGLGRVVYFLDPGYKNISFLPNYPYIKKFKIDTYDKFSKKITNQIEDRNSRYITNKKIKDNFCLNSKNVTKNIYNVLRKFK